MGSSGFCAAYQSGSTQISATQDSVPGGGGVGDDGTAGVGDEGGATTGVGAEAATGSDPVVKSYPQVSQNRAPAAAGEPQFEHVVAAATREGAGSAGAAGAAAIGEPQTSQ